MTTPRENLDELLRRLCAAQADWQARFAQSPAAQPPGFSEMLRALTNALNEDPERLRAAQARYYREQSDLWLGAIGQAPAPGDCPLDHDARFSAAEWREIPWFDYLRRSYASTARWIREMLESVATDEPTRRKLMFYGRQYIDAISPSNFAFTNPEVIKLAHATQGESLRKGLENLSADTGKGRVSMTDESAFAPGRNLALTPGEVIYQNELIQLLQYRPSTPTVHQRPLLIVPPFINKYYILDLQPANSFVRHAVDRGLTVFMVSWRNVNDALGHSTWDDYITHGVFAAIDAVRRIQPRRKINALGFCVGGTLLASALAVLARRKQHPVHALTLLATMLDFCDPGDIRAYIDEAYVRHCEETLGQGGIVPGSRLAHAFASLRANDLVWRYVVNNYLKGRAPPAFDLLYWNSDSANLPGPLYAYYLRNMYLDNALRDPDRLTMCGVPVDLRRIGLPTYVMAAVHDHIVPWHTAYASAILLGERSTFVLAASGHIAGVISPPGQPRRSYRTGPMQVEAQAWMSTSAEHPGSWWEHWAGWIRAHSGTRIRSPKKTGGAALGPVEPAPGSYVTAQA